MGPEINIASTPDYEVDPHVALKPGGGGFVVAYDDVPTDFHTINGRVAEVSASDTVTTLDTGYAPDSVSIDFFGDYLITQTVSVGGTSVADIYGRRGYMPF
jgi:hypothetical protein